MNRIRFYSVVKAIILLAILIVVCSLCAKIVAYYKKPPLSDKAIQIDPVFFKDVHTELSWLNYIAKGISLNEYLRKEIAEDYLKAWQLKNLHTDISGLSNTNYLDERIVEKSQNLHVADQLDNAKQIDLSHHLDLHFISLDRSIVSFTDKEVSLLSRIEYKDGSISYFRDTCQFEVLMRLTDGSWKIENLHILEERKHDESIKSELEVNSEIASMKGINYYPSETPWRLFWEMYDDQLVHQDLKRISDLGFTMVRFFVPFTEVGGAEVSNSFLYKMDSFIAEANRLNLKVVPCLFDFPVGFSMDQFAEYNKYLKTIVKRYADEECVLMWDLKNEADIDFNYHEKADVMAWLKYIIHQTKKYDPDTPVTIGWAHYNNAHILAEELDVVSFHYYLDESEFNMALKEVRKKLKNNKIIFVSEFGKSTKPIMNPFANQEKQQANYLTKMESIMESNRVASAIWCLYDYTDAPSNVFGWKPWIRWSQKKFGIINAKGEPKFYLQK